MLHYQRSGQGPTLVLQHGFLGGSGYFAPQIADLGRSHDVIAADLPGFAGSSGEDCPQSIAGLSEALIGLLDQLEIERFSLLGHSMGGMVALQAALDHPDRIEKLVLYGTSSSGTLPNRFESFEETIARVERDGVAATAARVSATWFVDGKDAPLYPLCLEAGRGAAQEAVIACLKAMPQWAVTERLKELAAPTLVICGEQDRSYSIDSVVQLARDIKTAQLCLIPGCAHNLHLEKPDLFNQVVGEFLSA